MGLGLEVGVLVDLTDHDQEGAEDLRQSFLAVNELLREAGLEPHDEPISGDDWSAEMYGYSGLHYLRRIAAHIDGLGQLPEPGDDDSSDDPVLDAYFSSYLDERPKRLTKLLGTWPEFSHQFDHLIIHSDAEGFYLPQEFDDILFADDGIVPGGMIGSASQLLRELAALANILEIPEQLNPESEALWEAADSQGEGKERWERYGIESFSCVVLREGCRQCLKTGAALVFV